jgi:hypothetical protein
MARLGESKDGSGDHGPNFLFLAGDVTHYGMAVLIDFSYTSIDCQISLAQGLPKCRCRVLVGIGTLALGDACSTSVGGLGSASGMPPAS